jgi:hypothetical protein
LRTLGLLAAVALFAQQPNGAFEIELWPGEGRPQFHLVANELALHETPAAASRIVQRLRRVPGAHIAFDETRYRTIDPGQLRVLETTSITGRVLGPIRSLTRDAYYKGHFPRQAVACKQGDVVEYLQYRAEGTCMIRVGDQVIDADPCPVRDDRLFRLGAEPKTEWWIRVVLDGVPVGWAMVDGKALEENGRTF